ncbi:pyrimidine dimer DNA glycosylase/endonuclease V [Aeromonas phage 1233]|nr:pyrimidine dimer DNA glycosylase/endonuclease V [Aeromonas phage 1233]
MNIFFLDESPVKAAEFHCDRHVVKMILETAQLCSTAHVVLDGVQVAYKATHINHPSAVWVRMSSANYEWAYKLLVALCEEYRYRYGKTHATEVHLEALGRLPKRIRQGSLTPIALAMPDVLKGLYKGVEAYRMYYSLYKRVFSDGKSACWTKRPAPDWF